MNFPIEQAGQNAVVIRVGASLDFRNASDFKAIVQQQVDTGIRRFILDFSETNVLDSTDWVPSSPSIATCLPRTATSCLLLHPDRCRWLYS